MKNVLTVFEYQQGRVYHKARHAGFFTELPDHFLPGNMDGVCRSGVRTSLVDEQAFQKPDRLPGMAE
ncbi:MAG: hypothetical protein H6564_18240 [Lewinellaceae bacterium]|nr:hypothetical protein [Lewinellaceae bacterium]